MAKRKAFRVVIVVDPGAMDEEAMTHTESLISDLIERSPAAAAMTVESLLGRTPRIVRAESFEIIDRPGDLY